MDSETLYLELDKTYKLFDHTYENVLNEYYREYVDVIKQLYINNSQNVRGIVFVDGTYKITSDLLTDLFKRYSTCIVLCVCLTPAERHEISQKDINKAIYFENLSIMRYMDSFFNYLLSFSKQSIDNQLVIYNSTLYYSMKHWINKNQKIFQVSYSIDQLQSIVDGSINV